MHTSNREALEVLRGARHERATDRGRGRMWGSAGRAGVALSGALALLAACAAETESSGSRRPSDGRRSDDAAAGAIAPTLDGTAGAPAFGNPSPESESTRGLDESCTIAADCASGAECVGGQCATQEACGTSEFAVDDVPPNVMVLLDRSCSMLDANKWDIAVAALDQLTQEFGSRIRWGLQLYPDATGDECTLEPPSVEPGPDGHMQVAQVLSQALSPADLNYPDGPCNTMTGGALAALAGHPTLHDATRSNHVLLITDGAEFGCQKDESATLTTVQGMLTAGTTTFVVGFGSAVDAQALEELAQAGGAPRPTVPAYYQADDSAGLKTALAGILGAVVGCEFALGETPPRTDELYAFLDDKPVTRDDPDGWVYDEPLNQVRFQGASCQALQSGSARDIDVVFGCPEPVLE